MAFGRKKAAITPSDSGDDGGTSRKSKRSLCARLATGDLNPCLNLLCCPLVGLYQSIRIYLLPCCGIYLRSLLFNVLCGCCRIVPFFACCFRYTDKKFKHDHTSLGTWRGKSGAALDDDVKWERAQPYYAARLTPEQKKKGVRVKLFEKGIEPKDVAQGQVGNCWLIAALACVAEHPGLVRKCLVTKIKSERGKYTCRLFDWQQRKWVSVSVDEFIPLTATDRQMLFAQPNGHELWVSMVEKAFAKFCGSCAPAAHRTRAACRVRHDTEVGGSVRGWTGTARSTAARRRGPSTRSRATPSSS